MTNTQPLPSPNPKARLLGLLDPVLARIADLGLDNREGDDACAELLSGLDEEFPYEGEAIREIGAEIERGIAEGWLCDRGEPNARFSRVAKPSAETMEMSIDVVALCGEALRHTHPRGELTLGFPATADDHAARFDGRKAGWVFMPPGSTHTPTVTRGTMNLIYFLPGGAVDWHHK